MTFDREKKTWEKKVAGTLSTKGTRVHDKVEKMESGGMGLNITRQLTVELFQSCSFDGRVSNRW